MNGISFFKRSLLCLCTGLLVVTGGEFSSAYAKETVKVGFVGPLTGGLSSLGMGGRNSADLAVQERNENPNSKYHYELVVLDDEGKPNVGVQVVTKLASDRKVAGVVAHYVSAVALSTVDIFHRFGMPAIIWGAVHPDITYGNNYKEIFRIPGTMINQNEVAAKFMTGLGYKKFAIIHDTTDYGKGHASYFSKYVKENGGEIVGQIGVTSNQQDFTAELTKIKSLDPQVLYFASLVPTGVRVRAQMVKLGMTDIQFEGVSGIKSDAFIHGVGDEAAEGCMCFIEGAPLEKLPGGAAFLTSYEKHGYEQSPEAMGPFAYAAMVQLLDAIESEGPNHKKIIGYLQNIKSADTLVGKVTYDDHGQNIEPAVSKYIVQDGQWVSWEDSKYCSGERALKKLNR